MHDISFHVYEGETVTLAGANCTGKSFMLCAISGIVPYSGMIIYDRHDLRDV